MMINAGCLAEPLPGYRHSRLNLAVAVSRMDTPQCSLPSTTEGVIDEAEADDSEHPFLFAEDELDDDQCTLPR